MSMPYMSLSKIQITASTITTQLLVAASEAKWGKAGKKNES